MIITKMISEVNFTQEEKESIKNTYKLIHDIQSKMSTDAEIKSDLITYEKFYDWYDLVKHMEFLDDLWSGKITIEYDPED